MLNKKWRTIKVWYEYFINWLFSLFYNEILFEILILILWNHRSEYFYIFSENVENIGNSENPVVPDNLVAPEDPVDQGFMCLYWDPENH